MLCALVYYLGNAHKQNMINYYYKTSRDVKTPESLDSFKKGAWVHVEGADRDELIEIAEQFKLNEDILLDVLDENEMPRVEREDDVTYIFTRHAYTNDDLQITTAPILFIMAAGTLITISRVRFVRIDRFVDGKIDFVTNKQIELMLELFDQIDDEYEMKLNSISRQIKSIRSRLRVEEIRNKDFIDFVTIEDVLNDFLSALSPTNSILRRLLLGRHLKLDTDDKDLVEDLLLNNEQSIIGCKSSLKTIVNIREAYSTIMSNNLNRIIRLLTILTVVISIPTLIASIYGMNVALPFEGTSYAFPAVMSVSLLLTIVAVVMFRRSRWF